MFALLLLTLLQAEPAPTDQALIYFNARMALREGQAMEALKLWLLRNAVEAERGQVSAYDGDFHSIAWAALAELGLCQDGLPKDESGVGLWPLALHNWVIRSMRRPPPALGASPFLAFGFSRQQRFVSIHDVLEVNELRTLRFHPSGCLGLGLQLRAHPPSRLGLIPLLFQAAKPWRVRLSDKQVTARLLRELLREALKSLFPERIIGRGLIEARIFDLNLRLARLASRGAKQAQRQLKRRGRQSGLSKKELAESSEKPLHKIIPADSEEGRILRESLSWSVDEWMSMSSARRQLLFAHTTRMVTEESASVQALKLAIIDRLIEARQGKELQSWIAYLSAPDSRGLIWRGDRGRQILSLDQETGFQERAVIALHRGLDFLSAGELPEAIRTMAQALRWAETSRAAEEVRRLSRRWLCFLASQFRVTDELFSMLRSVVPRGDYALLLEDQLWHAALGADERSFERCVHHKQGWGALNQRIELLRPLAKGEQERFSGNITGALAESPYASMRFLRQLIERLQGQEFEVRARHLPMLRRLKKLLEEQLQETADKKQGGRAAESLIIQVRATIEGLGSISPQLSEGDKAQALSPDHELFAGSLRLAPSDPLPWPFKVIEPRAPSVFSPISLRPEEWRVESGALIFGWRLTE